ncbi:DUF1828 domain-containing protein [Massilia forsythiae]|uniref:DUF1828 domain-containing protein n=1 Tax=Massilia forsythiae TaxID=2728020 RepID=A0A7Z2VTG8_9BURK|nr:DUF1828 domain-containing protein [Massilia forsythiae]QJD98639.1 DUF1828 domain-containing protein [Massilia forsythiae]
MNCAEFSKLTQWTCTPAGEASVRVISPISFGDSGHNIAFYLAQPSAQTFYLTDACEAAMQAEQLGIALHKSRLEALNDTPGVTFAHFAQDWSIEASGPISCVQTGLWDAVKLALALSNKSNRWRPRYEQAKFSAMILRELQAQLGADRVIREAKVQGASGHMIEFPAAIKPSNGPLIYVQPVALDNNRVSWPSIYEFHGKLFDLKVASQAQNRVSIIQAIEGEAKEFDRAKDFLANASTVYTSNQLTEFVAAVEFA